MVPPIPDPRCVPVLLLIDNYDSFTYNLFHYLGELGADVRVVRNDEISAAEALGMKLAQMLKGMGADSILAALALT